MRDDAPIATASGSRCERVRPDPGEPVEVQLMSEAFLDIFEARDISVTGVGIYVPYRFEGCRLTSPVDLVVTLPGAVPFLAKGRLVHRTKLEREFFGVEFAGLSFDSKAKIARYVEQRLSSDRQRDLAESRSN